MKLKCVKHGIHTLSVLSAPIQCVTTTSLRIKIRGALDTSFILPAYLTIEDEATQRELNYGEKVKTNEKADKTTRST